MSRRSNFIDGNDNFRDQNLRFVRNDLEDNINQYFGGTSDNPPGAGPSGSAPPPRDSIIVQPKPGTNANKPFRSTEVDERRQYLLQLGLKRQQAHALAVATMRVPDFNMRDIRRQRFRLSVEAGDSRQAEVDAQIIRDINALVDAHKQRVGKRPITPPPPSDINWHTSPKMLSNYAKVSRQRETSPINNRSPRRTLDNIRGQRVEQNERRRQPQNLDRKERNFERRDQNRRSFDRNEQNFNRDENIRGRQQQNFEGDNYNRNRESSFEREENFRGRQPENFERNTNFFEREKSMEREENFRGRQFQNFERVENIRVNRSRSFERDDRSQERQPQNFRDNDSFFEMDQHFSRQNNFSENQSRNFEREVSSRERELIFERDDNYRGHQTQNFDRNEILHNARQNFERDENFRERQAQHFEEDNVLRGHHQQNFDRNDDFDGRSSNFEREYNFRGHQNFEGDANIREEEYFNNSRLNENSNLNNEDFDFNQRSSDGDDFNNCRSNNFDFNRNRRQSSPETFDRENDQLREKGQRNFNQIFENSNIRNEELGQRNLNRNFENSNINNDDFRSRFNDDNDQRFYNERNQKNSDFNREQFDRPCSPNFDNRNDHFHNNDGQFRRSDDFGPRSDFNDSFRGQQVQNFGRNPSEDNFPHQIQTVFYEKEFNPEYDALLDVDGRLAMERRNIENNCNDRSFENFNNSANFESRQHANNNPRNINQNMNQTHGQFQNRPTRNNSLERPIHRSNAQNIDSENNYRTGPNRPTTVKTNTRFSGQRPNPVGNKPPIAATTSRATGKPGQQSNLVRNIAASIKPQNAATTSRTTGKPDQQSNVVRNMSGNNKPPIAATTSGSTGNPGQQSNLGKILSGMNKPPLAAVTSQTVGQPGQLNKKPIVNKPNSTQVVKVNTGINEQSKATGIKPTGLCVKSFKVNSNEKFFINVCQAPEVPCPKDITDQELIHILESVEPGSFRVPMSISELRNTKDRSNNAVEVCDIAINPKFLLKIKKSQLFNNFFLQIVAEALSEKYNIQISMDKTIILSNRQVIGNLVAHRVRNDDVQRVEKSNGIEINLQQASPDQAAKQANLVQEIDAEHASNIRKNWAKNHEPVYKLRAKTRDEVVDEVHVELYLPNCVSSQEFSLDIGEDRILIESLKHGYIFDKFVNYRLNQERAQALFDKTSKMLQVRIPVHGV